MLFPSDTEKTRFLYSIEGQCEHSAEDHQQCRWWIRFPSFTTFFSWFISSPASSAIFDFVIIFFLYSSRKASPSAIIIFCLLSPWSPLSPLYWQVSPACPQWPASPRSVVPPTIMLPSLDVSANEPSPGNLQYLCSVCGVQADVSELLNRRKSVD